METINGLLLQRNQLNDWADELERVAAACPIEHMALKADARALAGKAATYARQLAVSAENDAIEQAGRKALEGRL